MTLEKAKNVLVSGVELNWAKLDRPVSPFGVEQYEIQIASDSKDAFAPLIAVGLEPKEKDGKFVMSLKRKAKRSNGEDNGAPRVVNAKKEAISGSGIGNGSIGNVIVYVYPYEVMGRKGVASSISAVQVIEMKEYVGGVDFDAVDAGEDAEESAVF